MKRVALGLLLFSLGYGQTTPVTRIVRVGDDLQSVLHAAQPGDTIVLAADGTWTGNFMLPAKPEGLPITVTSSATLPLRRITPDDAPLLPRIVSPNADPTIACSGCRGWRFEGVRIASLSPELDVVVLEGAVDVTFDRVFIRGTPAGQKRGIRGNGRNITLTRSWIDGIWKQGQDSQAFCAWSGAGPYTITDNFLEAAGENVMFGGAASASPADVPADILVEGNTISKPEAWREPHPSTVKNLFELKAAKRVIVRNNLFERNWTDAQNGYAILFTVRNDDGNCDLHPAPCTGQSGAPWTVVEDVLFEGNTIRDVERGLNIIGYDVYAASGRGTRFVIRGNRWQTRANFFQAAGEVGELTISENTVENGGLFGLLYHGDVWPATETPSARRQSRFAVERLVMERNTGKRYDVGGVLGESAGWETKAFTQPTPQHLNGHAPGAVWTDNVLAFADPPPPPPPPPPVNPCEADPFRPTVTKWPSSQTRSSSGTWNPNGKTVQSAQFLWGPQRFVAVDTRTCSATVTR